MEKEDLARVTAEADCIFVGRVASQSFGWDANERKIFTYLQFDVIEGIKGTNAGDHVSLRMVGGTAEVPGKGALTLTVPGVPKFTEGERVLLFTQDDPHLLCPIAGWFQGAFKILQDPRTGRDVAADHEGHYLTGIVGNAAQVEGTDGRVEANELVARVRALVTAEPAHSGADAARPDLRVGTRPGKVEIVHEEPEAHGTCERARCANVKHAPSSLYVGAGLVLLAIGAATMVWSARKARNGGVR